ncbi:MAG: VPLPA-CTERM sorting domain-containing protein [Sulfitobacter sp.]
MIGKIFKAGTLGVALAVAGFSTANAAIVQIATEEGVGQTTQQGIRDETGTTGLDLAGMLVTANYADGSSEQMTWAAINEYDQGEATGAGTHIFASWAAFELTATQRLSSLLLQAAPASSIFDMSLLAEGDEGNTPTTLGGYPFRVTDDSGLGVSDVVTATYSGIVTLAGYATGVDAYTDLLLDFSQAAGGGLLGYIEFETDLDTLRVSGDLSAVPVPGSFWLLLAGIGGLLILRRRQNAGPALAMAA